jgi:hypothetical protein
MLLAQRPRVLRFRPVRMREHQLVHERFLLRTNPSRLPSAVSARGHVAPLTVKVKPPTHRRFSHREPFRHLRVRYASAQVRFHHSTSQIHGR